MVSKGGMQNIVSLDVGEKRDGYINRRIQSNLAFYAEKVACFNSAIYLSQVNQYSTFSFVTVQDDDRLGGFVLSSPIHVKSSNEANIPYIFESVGTEVECFDVAAMSGLGIQ